MAGALPPSSLPGSPLPHLLCITLDLQALTFLPLPSLSFPEFLEAWHPNQPLDSSDCLAVGLSPLVCNFPPFSHTEPRWEGLASFLAHSRFVSEPSCLQIAGTATGFTSLPSQPTPTPASQEEGRPRQCPVQGKLSSRAAWPVSTLLDSPACDSSCLPRPPCSYL